MTFSIVGRCPETGQLGIAISSSSIAVGARCPWLRAGVGAVANVEIEGLAAPFGEHLDRVVEGPGIVRTQTLTAFRAYSRKDLEQERSHNPIVLKFHLCFEKLHHKFFLLGCDHNTDDVENLWQQCH